MSNKKIQFGLYLPQLRMSYDRLKAAAILAEELGFDSIWLMDHLWAPGLEEADTLEAWTIATALAVNTSTIRIGHMVLCNQFRHPALLAKMAVSLDNICNGRLELGIGWGSVEDEMKAFGIGDEPKAIRAARLAETLDVLQLLFSGERVDYEGRYYQLKNAICRPRPIQQKIPIHIGGAGPRLTMPLVKKYADWWNCVSYGNHALADLIPLAGDAKVSTQHPIGLVQNEASREKTVATAERRFGNWGGLITGDSQELVQQLQKEVDLGVELFILQFSDFDDPTTLSLFAKEVMPALRR